MAFWILWGIDAVVAAIFVLFFLIGIGDGTVSSFNIALWAGTLIALAGVHPVHLARTFRREYGVTVGEYARALRLDWAQALLSDPDLSLAEVAAGAGFADQSHFTRAFRAYAGVTPGRYRELLRR